MKKTSAFALSRRRLLRQGTCLTAAGVLAACSSEDPEAPAPTTQPLRLPLPSSEKKHYRHNSSPLTNVTSELPIQGFIAPGFEEVLTAFEQNFREHGEIGASVGAYWGGKKVVDLWGGIADPATGTPYTAETLQMVFSASKGPTALCANILADRGELDIDAPVSDYWPEFQQAGKENMPVRWILDHRAGLIDIDKQMRLSDVIEWNPVVQALAAQAPLLEPGKESAYHAITFGFLVGEIVRRVSGKTLGQFLEDEVAAPLNLNMWIGLPPEAQSRVAQLLTEEAGGKTAVDFLLNIFANSSTLLSRALASPGGAFGDELYRAQTFGPDIQNFNRPEILAAEVPAANCVTTGVSLAKMYASIVSGVEREVPGREGTSPKNPGSEKNGAPEKQHQTPTSEQERKPKRHPRILSPAQLAKATISKNSGPDRVLLTSTPQWGLGFMLLGTQRFGHEGIGGAIGWADPEHELGFGYATNYYMFPALPDARANSLRQAVYKAVKKAR